MIICLSSDLHDFTYVNTGVHLSFRNFDQTWLPNLVQAPVKFGQPKPISSMLFACFRWFSVDYFHLLENQNCQDISAWC